MKVVNASNIFNIATHNIIYELMRQKSHDDTFYELSDAQDFYFKPVFKTWWRCIKFTNIERISNVVASSE